MRIVVCSALEASSLWAHAINTVKMAHGFARLGHEVTIVCLDKAGGGTTDEELRSLYGLKAPIKWVKLPGRILRWSLKQQRQYALAALPFVLRERPGLVYARAYVLPALTARLGIPTVAETHAHMSTLRNEAPNAIGKFLFMLKATRLRAFRGLITISERLAEDYFSLGVPRGKILVLPDAVDFDMFRRPETLPPSPYGSGKPIATYAGHLYDYKGIGAVLEAAGLLPEVSFHLVGGWPDDVARWKAEADRMKLANVAFHGMVPHSDVPPFLWHADVLLLPPSAKHPSAAWTSPVKLGEYLASGTPVVATEIPALRDWLSEDEVIFVAPDDGRALADGIRKALEGGDENVKMTEKALCKARSLSYKARAAKILDAIGINKA